MFEILSRGIRRLRGISGRVSAHLNKLAVRGVCDFGTGVRFLEKARVRNASGVSANIMIGNCSVILGELETFCGDASIVIGNYSYIGPGSNVMAFCQITIGNRVQISHGVNIYDSNSHSTSAQARYQHMRQILTTGHPSVVDDIARARVDIEDDVWIGFGATIMKGVRVGRGAIIGARSVVTSEVPEYSIVVGNPQRIVGRSRP